jgi:Polyketide cyclase / dehydrase and lipid transport
MKLHIILFSDTPLEPMYEFDASLSATQRMFRSCCATIAFASTFVVAALLGGCASITSPASSPKGSAVMPSEVSITRTALIPGATEAVFAFIAAEDVLPKVLTGYGPLPAVVRTSDHTGPWDQVGSARVVHLADGGTAREQVTLLEAPRRFAYRVWDISNPIISALTTEARGDWTFVAVAQGTQVTWTYTFVAKNAIAAVPLSAIAQVLWRGYMDVCLENSVRLMTPHKLQ